MRGTKCCVNSKEVVGEQLTTDCDSFVNPNGVAYNAVKKFI